MNFDSAFTHVVTLEGGYVNDPNDPGGETKFGISKRAFPGLDIKGLTILDAKQLYYDHYWRPCKCDGLPFPLNFYVFDAAVNQGVTAAIKMLQETAGVPVDGIIGPKTLAAVQHPELPHLYMAARAIRYTKTPGSVHYLRGWLKRLFKLAREA